MADPRKAHQDLMTAEAMSRRDEAVANIHRSRGIESEFTQRADNASEQEAERERLAMEAGAKDAEGTVTDRADAAGNVAQNAKQANEGGIGVAASNSGPEDQSARVQSTPTPTAADAATGAKPAPAKAEDKPDGKSEEVEIPENWEKLGWPERSALAKKLSPNETIKNGDDADKIIRTAAAKRK